MIFNYILKLLYLGRQWKELPIEKNKEGEQEIHYTRIYAAFRRYEAHGCFDAIFTGSVSQITSSLTLPQIITIGLLSGRSSEWEAQILSETT